MCYILGSNTTRIQFKYFWCHQYPFCIQSYTQEAFRTQESFSLLLDQFFDWCHQDNLFILSKVLQIWWYDLGCQPTCPCHKHSCRWIPSRLGLYHFFSPQKLNIKIYQAKCHQTAQFASLLGKILLWRNLCIHQSQPALFLKELLTATGIVHNFTRMVFGTCGTQSIWEKSKLRVKNVRKLNLLARY